jgi:hypothetical protein
MGRAFPSRTWITVALLCALLCLVLRLDAQEVGEFYHDVTLKEWDIELMAHTSGFGVGFQHGRTPDILNKHYWEIELLYNQHPKSVRSINVLYEGVRPCRYGQLYTLFFAHGGYGYQRTLHQKPYWGGVKVSWNFSGGISLGIGIPNYVEVLNYNTGFSEIVRYDPEKHNLNNVIGGGGFFAGILQTTVRPGFYAKTGLNFEFAKNDYRIRALEIGALFDMVFPFIQQMAHNPAKPCYVAGYIAFDFGRKKGVH